MSITVVSTGASPADSMVRDLARLALLLGRAGSRGKLPPGVRIERDVATAHGVEHDLITASSNPRAAWVAVHGMTRNGKDDARLQQFAAALASLGATCVVPTLPGLADLRLDARDVDALEDVVTTLASRVAARVNLVGFSYGGSYGLLVAARRARSAAVGRVVAFGAYHSLASVCDAQERLLDVPPRKDPDRDEWLYLRLAMAWRCREPLKLDEMTRAQLDSLLRRYCDDATRGEKEEMSARIGAVHDLDESCRAATDRRLLDELSPAGRLGGLRCAVTLVHDREDVLVPATEAAALHREIAGASGATRVHLAVTDLLRHVRPAAVFRPVGMLRLAQALRPLVR